MARWRAGDVGDGKGRCVVCRVTMGNLRVTIDHRRVTIGHLKATVVHIRIL